MKRITIAILALGIAGCQTTTPADASGWPFDNYSSRPPVKRTYKPVRKVKPKVVTRTVIRKLEIYDRCAPPLTREGDQYVSIDGAKDEANKAWSQAVRWKMGESMMDISHAQDVSYACSRSSVGSVAGQMFFRCEVTATPCRPPKGM